MKYTNIFRGLFLGMVLIPKTLIAQVDFNKTPNDKILDSKEKFQEYFFDALQQKGIENYDRAVVSLLKCVELDDSESAVYFELGKNYIQLQNFGAAENALKLAIDKNPNNEWYLNEIYGVYEQIDDYDNALKTIKVLTKYHPDYEENLAHLYFKHDKSRQALKVLDDMDNKYGYAKSRDYLRNEIYNARGDDQGRRPAFAVGHDGDFGDDAERHDADADRRAERQGRPAWQEAGSGRGGPGARFAGAGNRGCVHVHADAGVQRAGLVHVQGE